MSVGGDRGPTVAQGGGFGIGRWSVRGAGARWLATLAAVGCCLGSSAWAGFPNGGFESDLSNWTVSHLRNPATIPTFPPTTYGHLGLTADTTNAWSNTSLGYGYVYTDAVGSGADTKVGGAVTFPLYGLKAARINYNGNQRRASSIDQTATMTLADVDPGDGKVHIRFAVAPVLENPGHNPNEQPYFFVEVTNVTKGGAQLFYTFNFSNQTGVPWVTVGGYQYTDWQAIDIAPGAGVLDVGDQVNVRIVASGCGPTGHEGHIYVDSGAALTTLPGPYIKASAPQYTSVGSTITYTYTYGNSGTAPLTNTAVTVVSPQDNFSPVNNLTFASTDAGGACTTPSAGSAGTISCNFGTLNPNSIGTFTVTFNVPNPTTGPINHGNYKVSGDNSPAILGPLVQTNVTATPLVDLGVTMDDGQSSVTWGQTLTYTLVVSNSGPNAVPVGASIVSSLSANLLGATWTCAASAGTSCPNASGSGAINETTTATLPVGDTLTYTLIAQADPAGTGTGTLSHSVTVNAPGGVIDANTGDNTAADVDSVGAALSVLTVNKTGAADGQVSSVPTGISVSCVGACSDTGSYPTGSQVILYASAPAGSIFSGWSGGGCTGSASSCTVTLSGATAVTANFSVPLNVTPSIGANGTVTPSAVQPVAPGGTTSFTVTPDAGYAASITDNCATGGAQTGGTLVGTTYTTNAIAQDCTISFSFTNSGVATVTPTVGANGSITPNTAQTVLTGGSVSFTVVPNSGYAPATPGGSCPAGTWAGSVYTISPVAADCTVDFTFVAGHTVTGTATGGSGTISPTSATVAHSGTQAFTITPGSGNVAKIDPSSTCPTGTWGADGVTYTVPNITADCAVVAEFVAMSAGYPDVFDPPFGNKIATPQGARMVWTMVWANAGTAADPLVVVVDPIPAGTTYVAGSLTCLPFGASTTMSCLEPFAPGNPANQVMWTGSIAADGPGAITGWPTASNRVEISFQTTVPAGMAVTNTVSAQWDANGNGSVADEVGAGQVAVTASAAATMPVVSVPVTSREILVALALLLAAATYWTQGRARGVSRRR